MSNEAKYSIKFDSNAAQVGRDGASALEQLRQRIGASEIATRGFSDSLKRLKGSSDEVKAAKNDLKAKLDAEKTAISQATLELLKSGTSYAKVTEEHKKLGAEIAKGATEKLKNQNQALGAAVTGVGGPVAALRTKLQALEDVLGGANGATGLLTIAAITSVAAIGALAIGVVGLTARFASFVIESGNLLRTQQLTREAFYGNAEDAQRLGNQIDALGRKVPTGRAALNDLGNELAQAGIQGKTLVDTLNAVGQTSAALNDTAGNKIKDLVERGKLSQRFALGRLELQGTGLTFADVASALARNTKTSIADASQALAQGQVTLGDGAKALRDATEKRFGKVNLAKMLDLDVLKSKFSDTIGGLTSAVNITPLLQDASDLEALFDSSTESGRALKELVTSVGGSLVDGIRGAKPVVKEFIEYLVLGALDLQLDYLDLQIQFQDTFGKDALNNLDVWQGALKGVSNSLYPLREAVTDVGIAFKILSPYVDDLKAIEAASENIYKRLAGTSWKDVGASIVAGIVGPLREVVLAAESLGDDMIKAIKTKLGIASPSKRMADEIGRPSGEGQIKGHADAIEKGRATIDAAMMRGAGGSSSSASGSSSSSGAMALPPITVTVHHNGNAKGEDLANLKVEVRNAVADALEIGIRQLGLAGAG